MAVNNDYDVWTIQSGEDLSDTTSGSGPLFKAVSMVDGKIAANGKVAGGLLHWGGLEAGDDVELMYSGVGKFVAGAAVTAGKLLTVTASGYLIAATSGTYAVGRCGPDAVGSGAIGVGVFDFANPTFMGDQAA